MELSHFIEQFPQYTFKFCEFTLQVPVSPRVLDSPRKLRNFSTLFVTKILSVLTLFLLNKSFLLTFPGPSPYVLDGSHNAGHRVILALLPSIRMCP